MAAHTDSLEEILVVEDDDHIREVAELALSQHGSYRVETFASGREAAGRSVECDPDLILLDVMMPDVDGIEVLEDLRDHSSTRQIPVVFLTARAQPDELEDYRSLGVADVIVKPFDPVELPGRIREIWEDLD